MSLTFKCCKKVALYSYFHQSPLNKVTLILWVLLTSTNLFSQEPQLCLLEENSPIKVLEMNQHYYRVQDRQSPEFFVEAEVQDGVLKMNLHLKNSTTERSQALLGHEQFIKIFEHFQQQGVAIHTFTSHLRVPTTHRDRSDTLKAFNNCMAGMQSPNPEHCIKRNWIYKQAQALGFGQIRTLFYDDTRLAGEAEFVQIELIPNSPSPPPSDDEDPWKLFQDLTKD